MRGRKLKKAYESRKMMGKEKMKKRWRRGRKDGNEGEEGRNEVR